MAESQEYRAETSAVTEIVSATARLSQDYNYDAITFAMIAKEANFTRSNLYK